MALGRGVMEARRGAMGLERGVMEPHDVMEPRDVMEPHDVMELR